MEIKAVKFRRDGFYTQPFVMGGDDGPEKYDPNIRYRGTLYVRSADMSTIRQSMTVSHSRICPRTGNVRAASRARKSSIRHKRGFQEEKYDADIEAGYAEYRCCLS